MIGLFALFCCTIAVAALSCRLRMCTIAPLHSWTRQLLLMLTMTPWTRMTQGCQCSAPSGQARSPKGTLAASLRCAALCTLTSVCQKLLRTFRWRCVHGSLPGLGLWLAWAVVFVDCFMALCWCIDCAAACFCRFRASSVCDGAMPSPNAPVSYVFLQWIRFGDVPQGRIAYRVTMLRNNRSKGPVEYAWDTSHPAVTKGIVRIHPKAGTILPGDVEVIRFTFTADAAPEVFELDIGCSLKLTLVRTVGVACPRS